MGKVIFYQNQEHLLIHLNGPYKKKKALRIDQNVGNEENSYTYQEFTNSLTEYDIVKCKLVKEAFDAITKNNEDYKFKLFFVIVSGILSEKFFEQYVKKSLELHILCATIIYCSEKLKKMNEFKPFYLDNFLNPGKVRDSSYFVIENIKSLQYPYYLGLSTEDENENNEKDEKEKKKEERRKY